MRFLATWLTQPNIPVPPTAQGSRRPSPTAPARDAEGTGGDGYQPTLPRLGAPVGMAASIGEIERGTVAPAATAGDPPAGNARYRTHSPIVSPLGSQVAQS